MDTPARQPSFQKQLRGQISEFLGQLGVPSYAQKFAWEQVTEYPTDFFDLNLEGCMTLQWSAIESLFDGNWLEGPIFQWHRAAMEHKHRIALHDFIYSVNVQAIPTGLNARFLENDQEIALLAAQMLRLDNFTIEKPVLIPMYHERHWFLIVLHHIGTSPAIAILDSIRSPAGHLRYQLATRAVSLLYPQLYGVAEPPMIVATVVQVPQQPNGHDCGIFVLSFIEVILSLTVRLETLFGDNSVSNYWGTNESICLRRSEFRTRIAQSVKNAPNFHETFQRFTPRIGLNEPSVSPSDSFQQAATKFFTHLGFPEHQHMSVRTATFTNCFSDFCNGTVVNATLDPTQGPLSLFPRTWLSAEVFKWHTCKFAATNNNGRDQLGSTIYDSIVTIRDLSDLDPTVTFMIHKHPRLFVADMLLLPLNRHNTHWVLGVIVNPFNTHRGTGNPTIITVLDSMDNGIMDASATADGANCCTAPELDYLIRFVHALNRSSEARAFRNKHHPSTSRSNAMALIAASSRLHLPTPSLRTRLAFAHSPFKQLSD
ncbi:hypothetical protein BCR44DRAFT_61873 [Catenaria anguillulae PL171]|uniref:Ubiquitin-like protease family profile domain-containing protein n=1 Tax=Catenaria anguillulae PL171 TaxID=765915 RepID=A0A1Y2HEJ2_9FUNG|nr:hypothetical protein BCR44DRAFT_61873 [Catenaria anguillulae PL171]